ncbi:MAG: FAD-dependent oxidoreductase [Nitrospiraceae bacterium]|nr:MAG: FAD-dependent oxidoreductase [Nitrospiraceae bacterium]
MNFPITTLNPSEKLPFSENSTIVLGGGLAGLSSAYVLAKAGQPVAVFENDPGVGGLSKTIHHGEYKFDLGGHRFLTSNEQTERFIRTLLDGEYLTVPRKSKIFMNDRFFDYPLKPANALLGLGMSTTLKAVADYGKEKIKNSFKRSAHISLEDWVVAHFGRTMFNIYFREYSEKVWGLECKRISEEWVSKRIEGLSLGVAIKNALFKFTGKKVPTLMDKFIYPQAGIGRISDKLKEEIEKGNSVVTSTRITQINHKDSAITNMLAKNCERTHDIKGDEFVSSIPLTTLVKILNPAPPDDILEAASKLRYRDLAIVTIMLDKERVTDLTWLYLPEKDMPLGRIHEPKNWSPQMAPEGKTSIVAEYFCFREDKIWNSTDEELASITVKQLEKLGLINRSDVIDKCILRVPNAYPVFEVGYREHYSRILEYLKNFKNLHIIGRSGMFRYYNMDRAIETGIETAEKILMEKSRISSAIQ